MIKNIPKSLRKFISLAGILLVIIFILWLTQQRRTPSLPTEKAWLVQTIHPEMGTYRPNLVLHGTIESINHTTLHAAIGDTVQAIHTREGDSVLKDQILLELNPSKTTNAVKEAEAQVKLRASELASQKQQHLSDKIALEKENKLYDLAKKQVDRLEKMVARNAASQSNLDDALATLQQRALNLENRKLIVANYPNVLSRMGAALAIATANLSTAEINLDHTTIRAPFDGSITEVYVAVGEHVAPGAPLIKLYDINHLTMRVQVPEQYANVFKQALDDKQPVTGYYTLSNNTQIMLALIRLSSHIKAGSGGVAAFFAIKPHSQLINLGNTVEIYINLPPIKASYRLPEAALFGNNTIYLIHNDRLVAQTITVVGSITATNQEKSVLIHSDVPLDKTNVLITHLPNARTGLKIAKAS